LHFFVFILVVVMAASTRLSQEVYLAIFVVVLEESTWRALLASEFSISAVHALFELASLGNIEIIVIAFIVDISIVVPIILARFVVLFEIASKQINSVFVFSHLFGIVNVESKLFLHIVVVVSAMLHRVRWRGGSNIASGAGCTECRGTIFGLSGALTASTACQSTICRRHVGS
jgi:hypothetical protein